jgi:selenocysteine lyase/cysteine desulfurase
VRPGVEQQIQGIRQGGTGSQSELDRQPDFMPDRFEAGNPNVAGLAGLAAGVRWLETRGVPAVRREAIALTETLLEGLREITGITIHGPADAESRVGLVSVTLDRYDPQELAATLDAAFGVQVRPGLHCAPLAHAALGTIKRGGTVRFSVGALSSMADVEQAVAAMREIAAASVAL